MDDRAAHWQRLAHEHGTLMAWPNSVRNARSHPGTVPSYIRWKIANTAWLPVRISEPDGSEAKTTVGKPAEAITPERTIELVFPRPLRPPEIALNKYGLTATDI